MWKSLLQTYFFYWAQSQYYGELLFFVQLVTGGQEGSKRREQPRMKYSFIQGADIRGHDTGQGLAPLVSYLYFTAEAWTGQ
jgi:hypothetical protein